MYKKFYSDINMYVFSFAIYLIKEWFKVSVSDLIILKIQEFYWIISLDIFLLQVFLSSDIFSTLRSIKTQLIPSIIEMYYL